MRQIFPLKKSDGSSSRSLPTILPFIVQPGSNRKQDRRSILFTNARDEHNILEWVVHHLNLGFCHIHITDHLSVIPISKVLKNVPSSSVSVVREEGSILKSVLIRKAFQYAVNHQYEWMMYLDADEFLVLNYDDHLHNFFDRFQQNDQVSMNWLYFGSNYHVTTPTTGTLVENYIRCASKFDPHIKSFLNVFRTVSSPPVFFHPHFYPLKDMTKSVHVDGGNLDTNEPYYYKSQKSFKRALAYIAHYVFQSYERYRERKINLPRDDIPVPTFREVLSAEKMHSMYNEEVNQTVYDKYNKRNSEWLEKFRNG
jgi:hypothetical protein